MNLTLSASRCIRALDMTEEDALAVVQAIEPRHFYKAMTSHRDRKVWHDVYKPQWNGVSLYVKFTVAEEYVVISFKEDESEW